MPKTGTQLAEQDHKLAEGLGVDVTKKKSPTPPRPVQRKEITKRDTTSDTTSDTTISPSEDVRRRAKETGKEAAVYRFTTSEKQLLKKVVREYEDKKIKTSENVLVRISLNRVLRHDRKFLDKVIKALYK